MALIKCPNCGKMFSEHATQCPSCGLSIDNALNLNNKKKTNDGNQNKTYKPSAIVFTLLMVALGIGCIFYPSILYSYSLSLLIISYILSLIDIFLYAKTKMYFEIKFNVLFSIIYALLTILFHRIAIWLDLPLDLYISFKWFLVVFYIQLVKYLIGIVVSQNQE